MIKGVDERIDGVLQWFDHGERMENESIGKRVYAGESAGRLRKRLQDKSGWRGECVTCCQGYEPLALMKCHSYMKPFNSGSLSVAKPTI